MKIELHVGLTSLIVLSRGGLPSAGKMPNMYLDRLPTQVGTMLVVRRGFLNFRLNANR